MTRVGLRRFRQGLLALLLAASMVGCTEQRHLFSMIPELSEPAASERPPVPQVAVPATGELVSTEDARLLVRNEHANFWVIPITRGTSVCGVLELHGGESRTTSCVDAETFATLGLRAAVTLTEETKRTHAAVLLVPEGYAATETELPDQIQVLRPHLLFSVDEQSATSLVAFEAPRRLGQQSEPLELLFP
ncbi:hypothetical protein [Glutamicibacter sp. PS]|uniref:hypothetical protein n=1 Tax=Glutamicibacter sp. PS TaxID=3075634 RepID=UPI002840DB17|nr:hypothetical protein [Glutamicibacter sp. PS]MDR4532143.1 hypothetical protein [Glutamicibacter sp. PS]